MSESKPTVTIVTITYNLIKNNRKDFIIQNIKSVHNQTYKNIEHIIIDGASDDGTLELLKPYEEKGWIKIYSEPDNGIYDAMNKGIAKAAGDYISYLNSDDFYHRKNGVSNVIKALKQKKYDFGFSTCNFIEENGKFIGILKPRPENFYIRMPFCHQTLFVKTKLMKELNGFDDKNFKSAGDYDFIIRLYMSGAYGGDYNYNFVTFRLGGFSQVERWQSDSECIKAYKKNYGKFVPENMNYNFEKMFYEYYVHETIFNNIKSTVCIELAAAMLDFWNKKEYLLNSIKCIDRVPYIKKKGWLYDKTKSHNRKWYLFGVPIFRIKQKNLFEKKYYIFFIPVLKVVEKI